jgi:hypothetical protein
MPTPTPTPTPRHAARGRQHDRFSYQSAFAHAHDHSDAQADAHPSTLEAGSTTDSIWFGVCSCPRSLTPTPRRSRLEARPISSRSACVYAHAHTHAHAHSSTLEAGSTTDSICFGVCSCPRSHPRLDARGWKHDRFHHDRHASMPTPTPTPTPTPRR